MIRLSENRRTRITVSKFKEKTNCLAIGDMYLVVGCIKGAVYIFSPQNLDFIMSVPLPHYLGVDIGFITSIEYDLKKLHSDIRQFD